MDRRKAHLVILSCGITFFLGAESGGFQLVLLKVAEEFALNPVRMGGMVTSQFGAILCGPLLFGWIADRIGKKPVLLFSMIFYIIGCFAAAFSGTVFLFSCAVFALGLGFSLCECVGSAFISDSFPGKESTYLNIMQSAFSFGAVLSPLVFSRLIQAGLTSWRIVFFVAGGGYVLVYPLLILVREKKPHTEESHIQNAGMQQKEITPPDSEPRVFSPVFIILVLSMVIYMTVEAGLSYFADALFVTEFNNTRLGAYAISGYWFSMAVSRFVFSWIKIKPQAMVMLGFFLLCFLLVFSLPLRNSLVMLTVFFFLGFASGPIWPMIIGLGASLNQKRSGTSVSILTASGGLGGVIIPVLIGFIAEWKGFYNGFWLLAALSVLGFLVMLFGTKKFLS